MDGSYEERQQFDHQGINTVQWDFLNLVCKPRQINVEIFVPEISWNKTKCEQAIIRKFALLGKWLLFFIIDFCLHSPLIYNLGSFAVICRPFHFSKCTTTGLFVNFCLFAESIKWIVLVLDHHGHPLPSGNIFTGIQNKTRTSVHASHFGRIRSRLGRGTVWGDWERGTGKPGRQGQPMSCWRKQCNWTEVTSWKSSFKWASWVVLRIETYWHLKSIAHCSIRDYFPHFVYWQNHVFMRVVQYTRTDTTRIMAYSF